MAWRRRQTMQASSQVSHTRARLPVLEQRTSRRRFMRYALFGLLGAFTATSAVATYKMLYPNKVTGFGAKVAAGTVSDVKTLLTSQKYIRSTEGHFYLLPTTEPDHAIAAYWRCVHLGCTVPPPESRVGRQYPVSLSRLTVQRIDWRTDSRAGDAVARLFPDDRPGRQYHGQHGQDY